jgi:hypothetical protein
METASWACSGICSQDLKVLQKIESYNKVSDVFRTFCRVKSAILHTQMVQQNGETFVVHNKKPTIEF